MIALELACVAIVGLYVATRLARADDRAAVLRRFALLAVASWLAEDTVIRAYDFYAYSPRWSVFVDRVPLMILVIWPVVIDSAAALARRLLGDSHPRIPLLAAAFVLADASLIEPIAVRAGLWWWHEPGLFAVPPIGILGWAVFAVAAVAVFEANQRAGRRPVADAAALVIAPVFAHVVLVALWWACFRWINHTVPAWPAVAIAWLVLLAAAALAWRRRLRDRIPLIELLVRAPAAGFFFVLLALHGGGLPALVAYALAFAPPYLALMRWGRAAAR
ncbi:MAG: carotenoid biosynthesis protein [Kofleriaceae bacterium]